MNRARILATLALAAALAACNKTKVQPQGVQLSRPSSVAPFRGVVFGSPAIGTYLAIANEPRNDISVVNAGDDSPVLAPVSMKTLVIPVLRPAMLVSAPLGDEGSPPAKADLLVVVSAAESKLQLIRTWNGVNEVVAGADVDVGDDVLAAVALPQGTAGTARIAVALAGGRVAVVTYLRDPTDGIGIVPDPAGVVSSAQLPFQPLALAASTFTSAAKTYVYAATRDLLDPAAVPPVYYGVAVLDVTSGVPTYVSRLDVRGPTRLVAAALLRERVTTVPGATAVDSSAFTGQQPVARVYAVLDESACGISQRIDCGVAMLEFDPVTGAGGLLPDLTGRMPYRAPIPLPGRPVAIAVAKAPANPPSDAYTGDLMRLWPAAGERTSTAVAAVPCQDGRIYFLDLSRWQLANEVSLLGSVGATASSTSVDVRSTAGVSIGTVRLWVADTAGNLLSETATSDEVRAQIDVTPGYTRSETFTVGYQSDLPALSGRRAEAGRLDATSLWLAMTGQGGEPIRLWDPQFGVRAGDIVAVEVSGLPAGTACVGTDAPGAAAGGAKIFEARVAALLAPTADYPAGAVQLEQVPTGVNPLPAPADATAEGEAVTRWNACLDGLAAKVPAGTVAAGLVASIRAGGYVVTSDFSGHLVDSVTLSRPDAGAAGFTLEYPSPSKEDAPSCTLVPWPSTIAGRACDAACRSECEALLLARKSRRSYHVAESCAETDTTCSARWPGLPDIAGPLVKFRFALQATGTAPLEPRRGLSLRVTTSSGVSPFGAASASGQGALVQPNGATVFDRSTMDASRGYRFLVPYQGDFVIDTSPSLAGSDPFSIH